MKKVIRSNDLHDRVQEGLKKRRNDVFTPEDKDALRRINERMAKEEARLKRNSEDVTSSYDPTEADTYIVKITYEVDPGHDVAYPEAAEEILKVVATSPDEAFDYARKAWGGRPIDDIKIVDINPEDDPNSEDEWVPFEDNGDYPFMQDLSSSTKFDNSPAREASELIRFLSEEGVDEHTFVEFFYDNIPADKMIEMLKQLADECDIDLTEFYE